MPSIQDVMDTVELLNVKAIGIEETKCVAVRNRNSRCRKCADACSFGAIEVADNEVKVNSAACVNCGACVPVCPTGALSTLEPTEPKVAHAMADTSDTRTGCTIVACARRASKHEADPEKFAEVPCLGHIRESTLVRLAAEGFVDIVLVDGDCETCKYGAVSPFIDEALHNAAEILESCEAAAIVNRVSEFPPEVLEPRKSNVRGEDRRGILAKTGSYVRSVAGNVVKKTIDDRLGEQGVPSSLRDKLKVGIGGRMPAFKPNNNYDLLDSMIANMEEAGSLPEGREGSPVLSSRHFGDVEVDPEECSGCGMCVMFCPTEALKYADYDEPDDPSRRYLEFRAADCTQCNLCVDVCLRNCIEVSPKVNVFDLIDFEPKLIEISRPTNYNALEDIRRRRKLAGKP